MFSALNITCVGSDCNVFALHYFINFYLQNNIVRHKKKPLSTSWHSTFTNHIIIYNALETFNSDQPELSCHLVCYKQGRELINPCRMPVKHIHF